MNDNLQIVVTGASGFIGKNFRKFLSENNVKTISISRNDFKKFRNETKIISKKYNEKSIISKIKNSNALVHLIGIGKQTVENDFLSINTVLTQKIVELCKKSNIKKLIYTSGLGVSKKSTLGYFISKYKAEQHIINSNLDYTIFRPSYIVGKDDLLTRNLKLQMKKTLIKIPGSGKYSIQPIFINDVSKLILKSILEKNFSKKILDLVGQDTMTYEEYVRQFSYNTDTKIKKIDLELAYFQAISCTNPDFAVDDLNLLVGNFVGNHQKLKSLSKMRFESVKELLKTRSLF